MSEPTSLSLLLRLKEEDPAAWQRLVGRYRALVIYWCRRAGLSPEDAADVSQEVFCGVLQGIEGFQHSGKSGSFRRWLQGITRHKVIDLQRRKMRHESAAGGSAAQVRLQSLSEDSSPSTRTRPIEDPLDAILASIRQRYQSSTWQAFWLTAVEQQSPADVAKKLDLSVAAVYMARSRVLRALREEFDGLSDFS